MGWTIKRTKVIGAWKSSPNAWGCSRVFEIQAECMKMYRFPRLMIQSCTSSGDNYWSILNKRGETRGKKHSPYFNCYNWNPLVSRPWREAPKPSPPVLENPFPPFHAQVLAITTLKDPRDAKVVARVSPEPAPGSSPIRHENRVSFEVSTLSLRRRGGETHLLRLYSAGVVIGLTAVVSDWPRPQGHYLKEQYGF